LKPISKIIHLFFALLLLSACAKQNAGIVKQTYHDLTSHYNGYFNANENYNLHVKSLKKNRKEDYNNILPIYAYGSIEEIKGQGGTLSESIAKARLSIQAHQEKSEGKNYLSKQDNSISNWSDDAFLLIGKSYYMQGQMDSAISCFRYITAHFDEAVDGRSKNKIKKQKNNKKLKAKAKKREDKLLEKELKGKDIRPSNKFTVHESAKSQALIWLANAYASNQQYGEAAAILTYVRSDQTFLKNYDKEVEKANAYLFLAQENYVGSIPFVEAAIAKNKKQKNKARLQFILAQLYQKNKDKTTAAIFYKQSMKANENFEMIFYAKLKLIQMSRGNQSLSKETEKLIAKMSKDNKNKDYFDQLYYERALIALNNNEREEAKNYLNKSIKLSTNNTSQKAISFIELAQMNYDEENYPLAQAYYDSSLSLIDVSYPFYDLVNSRSSVLTDLIESLETIKMNDSLLLLAQLSPKELEAMLYKKAVDDVDEEIKQESKNKQNNLIASSATSEKSDKNAWYFYSEASSNSGYKKFKQTWGEIELSDNWRRSDKSSESSDDAEEETVGQDEYFARIDTKYKDMLSAVPNSDIGKNRLKTEIISGFYNAAIIYKVGLDNLPKSIEMFEALNAKFPKNSYEPEALYQLYLIHDELNNSAQSEKAKSDLLEKYPDNKFSSFIRNPEKIAELDHKKASEKFYVQAYADYEAENFDEAILKCEEANELYDNSVLLAKFDLLKAMCIGSKKVLEPFITALEYVVSKHNATEEQKSAQNILAYLRGEEPVDSNKSDQEKFLDNKKLDAKSINDATQIKKNGNSSIDDGGVKLKFGEKELNLGGKKGDSLTPGGK
jgi:tetratricopeptide (TPR) repeat protein